jgi:hypothetical protein
MPDAPRAFYSTTPINSVFAKVQEITLARQRARRMTPQRFAYSPEDRWKTEK